MIVYKKLRLKNGAFCLFYYKSRAAVSFQRYVGNVLADMHDSVFFAAVIDGDDNVFAARMSARFGARRDIVVIFARLGGGAP